MPRHDIDALRAVLNAAESVLAARETQMLTSDEWDDLEHAVAAATQPLPASARDETFCIVDDALIRAVVPARGTPYEHTCEREVYEAIAHAIDEMQMAGFTLEEVRQRADVPWTQGAVAIAFLKERGCIVPTVRRKHVAATEAVHINAMIEWHTLAEKRGEYLQLEFEVIEGPHKGRKVWDRLTLKHTNEQTVQIARGTLSAICRAVNVMAPKDSIELHNLPLVVSVGLKNRDDTGEPTNVVKGYAKRESNAAAGAARPAATANGSTPPWKR